MNVHTVHNSYKYYMNSTLSLIASFAFYCSIVNCTCKEWQVWCLYVLYLYIDQNDGCICIIRAKLKCNRKMEPLVYLPYRQSLGGGTWLSFSSLVKVKPHVKVVSLQALPHSHNSTHDLKTTETDLDHNYVLFLLMEHMVLHHKYM